MRTPSGSSRRCGPSASTGPSSSVGGIWIRRSGPMPSTTTAGGPIVPSLWRHPCPGLESRSLSVRVMFAAGTCSAASSMSTTAPRRDRIGVSDPHGLSCGGTASSCGGSGPTVGAGARDGRPSTRKSAMGPGGRAGASPSDPAKVVPALAAGGPGGRRGLPRRICTAGRERGEHDQDGVCRRRQPSRRSAHCRPDSPDTPRAVRTGSRRSPPRSLRRDP
jgi:hypothetical protein